jgi:hypothetical protein
VAQFPEKYFHIGSEVLAPQGVINIFGAVFLKTFRIATGISDAPK